MTLIVSDASPLHYLALIGEVHILPVLYGRVVIPQKVFVVGRDVLIGARRPRSRLACVE
jgi:predicted nucleic acid-binding protein